MASQIYDLVGGTYYSASTTNNNITSSFQLARSLVLLRGVDQRCSATALLSPLGNQVKLLLGTPKLVDPFPLQVCSPSCSLFSFLFCRPWDSLIPSNFPVWGVLQERGGGEGSWLLLFQEHQQAGGQVGEEEAWLWLGSGSLLLENR